MNSRAEYGELEANELPDAAGENQAAEEKPLLFRSQCLTKVISAQIRGQQTADNSGGEI